MAVTDGYFPVEQLAALLDVTPRRLQQLASDGWFERPERGRYHLVKTVQGYIKYLREGRKGEQRGSEQARLARAQAIKVEIENFRRMGELITRQQSDETNSGLCAIMKGALEGQPSRLASELAGIAEPREVHIRLQADARAILNQCADFLEKRAATLETMPEPGADRAPERTADADIMGGSEADDAGGQSGAGPV